MKVLFTDCWVGCYQGEGSYEGGTCPDCLVTNVPEDVDTDELFNTYLLCLCDGFNDQDKIEYNTKIVQRCPRGMKPVQITSLDELVNCYKDSIKIDFDDLVEWVDEYED